MKKISAYEQWKKDGMAFAKSAELRMGRTFEQLERAAMSFAESRDWCAHKDIIRRAFREGYFESINNNEVQLCK